MRRNLTVVICAVVLLVSIVGVAKKIPVPADIYVNAAPEAAAEALLERGLEEAGKGSWERIGVARFWYLGGDTERAESVFADYTGAKPDVSDLIRIGRVYAEAGDWEKARELLDRVVEMKPEDEDWLAEVGAWYNLNGDRERAEELFQRSFELDPDNWENLAMAGGSYRGVVPNP